MKTKLFVVTLAAIALLLLVGCSTLDPTATLDTSNSSTTSTGNGAGADMAADGSAMATVTARSLRVRSAPNPDAEVVAGIREGEIYKVLTISGDGEWVQLAVPAAPSGNGWVSANFVSVDGLLTGSADTTPILVPTPEPAVVAAEEPIAPPAPAAGMATVVTDGTRLRVRAEPNDDAEIVGYVYNGETYQVLERSVDGLWVKISGSTDAVSDNPNGGWVAAEFLVIGQ